MTRPYSRLGSSRPRKWNSTFAVSGSRLKRTPMKRSTKPMKRSRMKQAGKKSNQWLTVRRRLKIQFAAAGITSCELRYKGCRKDNILGFAHGRKRRHLKGDELETLTILACNLCHDKIEYLEPHEMLRIVQETIARRLRKAT